MKSFVRKVAAVLSLTMLLTSVDIGSLKVVRAETEGNNPVKPPVAGPVVAGSGTVTPASNAPARNTQGAGRAAAVGGGAGEQGRDRSNDAIGGIKMLTASPKDAYDAKTDLEQGEYKEPGLDPKNLGTDYLNRNLPAYATILSTKDPSDKNAANDQIKYPDSPKIYTYTMHFKLGKDTIKDGKSNREYKEFYQPYQITVGSKDVATVTNPDGSTERKNFPITFELPKIPGYKTPTKGASNLPDAGTKLEPLSDGKYKITFENSDAVRKLSQKTSDQSGNQNGVVSFSEDFNYEPKKIKYEIYADLQWVSQPEKFGKAKDKEEAETEYGYTDEEYSKKIGNGEATVGAKIYVNPPTIYGFEPVVSKEEQEKGISCNVPNSDETFKLVIRYKRRMFNVVFQKGVTAATDVPSKCLVHGQTLKMPALPSAPGFTFTNWRPSEREKFTANGKEYYINDLIAPQSELKKLEPTKEFWEKHSGDAVPDLIFSADHNKAKIADYTVTYWLEKADYTLADKEAPDSFGRTHAFLFSKKYRSAVPEDQPRGGNTASQNSGSTAGSSNPVTRDASSVEMKDYPGKPEVRENWAKEILNNASEEEFKKEGLADRNMGFEYDAATTEALNAGLKFPSESGITNVAIVFKRKRYHFVFGGRLSDIDSNYLPVDSANKSIVEYKLTAKYSGEKDAEGNRLLSSTGKQAVEIKHNTKLYDDNESVVTKTLPLASGCQQPYQFVARFGQETIGLWPLPFNNCEIFGLQYGSKDKDGNPAYGFNGWIASGYTTFYDNPPYRFDARMLNGKYMAADINGNVNKTKIFSPVDKPTEQEQQAGESQQNKPKEIFDRKVLTFFPTAYPGDHIIYTEFKIPKLGGGFDFNYRHLYSKRTDAKYHDGQVFISPSLRGFSPTEEETGNKKLPDGSNKKGFSQKTFKFPEGKVEPTEKEPPEVKAVRDHLSGAGMDPAALNDRLGKNGFYSDFTNPDANIKATEDIGIIVAKYTRNTHKLIVNNGDKKYEDKGVPFETPLGGKNGDTGALGELKKKYNIDKQQAAAGHPETWEFGGFYLDKACTIPVPKEEKMPDYNLNVYVKWIDPNFYMITVDLNVPKDEKLQGYNDIPVMQMFPELYQNEINSKPELQDFYAKHKDPVGSLRDGIHKATYYIKSGGSILRPTTPNGGKEGLHAFGGWEVVHCKINSDGTPEVDENGHLIPLEIDNKNKAPEYFCFSSSVAESCIIRAKWLKIKKVPIRIEHHFYNKRDEEIVGKRNDGQDYAYHQDDFDGEPKLIKDGLKGVPEGYKGYIGIDPNGIPTIKYAAISISDDTWNLIADSNTLKKITGHTAEEVKNYQVKSIEAKQFPSDEEKENNPNVIKFYYQPFKKRFYYKKYVCTAPNSLQGDAQTDKADIPVKLTKLGEEEKDAPKPDPFLITLPEKVKNDNRDLDTCNFLKIPGFKVKTKDIQKTVHFELNDKGDIQKINGQSVPPYDSKEANMDPEKRKHTMSQGELRRGKDKLGVEFEYIDVRVILRNSEKSPTPDGYHRVVVTLPEEKLQFTDGYAGWIDEKYNNVPKPPKRNVYVVDVVDGYEDANIPIPNVEPIKKLPVNKIWLDQRGHNVYSDEKYPDLPEDKAEEELDLESELDEAVKPIPKVYSKPLMLPDETTIIFRKIVDGKVEAENQPISVAMKAPDNLKVTDADGKAIHQPYWANKVDLPMRTPFFLSYIGNLNANGQPGAAPGGNANGQPGTAPADNANGQTTPPPSLHLSDIADKDSTWGVKDNSNPPVTRFSVNRKDPWTHEDYENLKKIDKKEYSYYQYTATEKNAHDEFDGYERGVFIYHKVKLHENDPDAAKKTRLFEVKLGGVKEKMKDGKNEVIPPKSIDGEGISVNELKELTVLNDEVPTIDVEVQKKWFGKYGKPLDFNTLSVGSAANPKPLTMEMRFMDPLIAKHLPTRNTALTAGSKWHGWIEAVRLKFRRTSPRTYDYELHEVGDSGGTLSYGGKKFDAIYIGRCLDGFKVINREQTYGFPPVVAICDCARMGMNKAYSVADRAYTAVSEAASKAGNYIKRQVGKLFGGNGRQTETNGQGGCSSCHLD
ncbi:hypothetical protein HMPREF0868_0230 [Mageeibacillus indolicus UPII9-5]|uniref:Repeat protein n=1 Tax=Mageeibacillus indolicus (strain UPII9-5) TaxID=699246 RepID=D3R061_MAGIU|nr:hypothetical protein [Mageeibacillus indolicus]ADC91837.1 hypothetical protein HMPREF0868_0230 [Mageeibacillus indolicus UPII9-5]